MAKKIVKKPSKAELKKRKELMAKMKAITKTKATKFNNEIKKSLTTAIVAAFGFLMALTWGDVITEYVDKLTAISPLKGKLISAGIITIICTAGILITTNFLSKEK